MLVGSKVRLDVIDQKNIEWMRIQRNDPTLRQYFREWKDISKDQQQKWYSERGNNTNPSHVYFEVHAINKEDYSKATSDIMALYGHNPDKSLVGCCGLHYVRWQIVPSAEFGIFLAQDVMGRGLAKESMRLLLNFAFLEMNLLKVWAECYDNNPAIGFYRHLGFKDDGISRCSYYTNGQYGNSYLISMLKEEWLEYEKNM